MKIVYSMIMRKYMCYKIILYVTIFFFLIVIIDVTNMKQTKRMKKITFIECFVNEMHPLK